VIAEDRFDLGLSLLDHREAGDDETPQSLRDREGVADEKGKFFKDFLSRHDLFTEKMIDEVGLNLKTFAQKSEMIDLADLFIWSWDINLLLSKIENTSRACMFLKTVPGSRVLLPICGSRESTA
jgi:hypothetical protein